MLGSGMYNLSSGLAAPFSDDMVRIWFVPSRTVAEYGARYAIAMRFPSGDHVGIPGAFSVSCSFVTLPLATSTTDPCALRGALESKSRLQRAYVPLTRVTCSVAWNGTVSACSPLTDRLRIFPSD